MCSLRAVALLFVVLAGVALSTCAAYEKNHMKRLLDALLNVNYSVLARPVRSTSNTTRVTMSMSLNQILELNPKYQILTINAFLSLKWEDHFLVWNPDHYGGIQVVYLRSVDIWRPDILLSNSVDDKRTAVEVLTDTIVTVKHKGVVIWSSPALFKSSCRLEVQNYPFDVQQCMLKFGSWSHQGSELELVTEQYQASRLLYDNNPNVEWNLLGVPCKKYPKRFPCCKDTFDYIVYFVTMQRRPLYYLYHLAFPIAQLMAMGAFVFLMPPESGAKVSLSINIVLAMVVFIHVLMDSIPPTSEIISLFAKYICGVTMLLSLTTYVSVIVMHVHFKGTHGRRPPVWLKKLLFYHVAVPLGMANNNCCEVFCGCRANLRRQSSVNQAGYFEDQEFLDNESAISVGVSMADIDGQFYDEYGLLEGEQAPDHSAAIKLGTGGASNESLTTESIHNSSVSAHNSSDNSRLSRSRDSTRNENRIDGFSQDPCASQSDFLKPPDQLSLKDQVSVNIIDVLVDILEELRLVHTIQSDIQLDSDSSEFVKAEWHKVAAIIDRGCLFLYTLSCLLLCGVLWYSVGSNPELASVRLPDDI